LSHSHLRKKQQSLLLEYQKGLPMQRGEVWTFQDDGYTSKARPVVILQGELGEAFNPVILCLLTTFDSSELDTRVRIEPSKSNGLKKLSYVMTDKIITVARTELNEQIGILADEQMHSINRQLARLLVITKEDTE
jgi:mRNA interferase MazF